MWQVMMAFDQLLKRNAHCYVMADGEYMPILLNWAREGELCFNYSKPLVWDKVNQGMGYHWRGRHEYIVMLEKGKRRLNDLGKADVLVHKRVNKGYPTEKPFSLVEEIILNSTQPGEWVLDPFAGSGTTGVACVRTGRRFVGIEIEPKYWEIAVRRVRAELERFPLFEPAARPRQLELLP
jgi:site-specific DNA-methyltransferase (adenine-specific)